MFLTGALYASYKAVNSPPRQCLLSLSRGHSALGSLDELLVDCRHSSLILPGVWECLRRRFPLPLLSVTDPGAYIHTSTASFHTYFSLYCTWLPNVGSSNPLSCLVADCSASVQLLWLRTTSPQLDPSRNSASMLRESTSPCLRPKLCNYKQPNVLSSLHSTRFWSKLATQLSKLSLNVDHSQRVARNIQILKAATPELFLHWIDHLWLGARQLAESTFSFPPSFYLQPYILPGVRKFPCSLIRTFHFPCSWMQPLRWLPIGPQLCSAEAYPLSHRTHSNNMIPRAFWRQLKPHFSMCIEICNSGVPLRSSSSCPHELQRESWFFLEQPPQRSRSLGPEIVRASSASPLNGQ